MQCNAVKSPRNLESLVIESSLKINRFLLGYCCFSSAALRRK